MKHFYLVKPQKVAFWLLLCLCGIIEARAQSVLDFSVLSEDNPVDAISQSQNYKEALDEGTWHSLNTQSGASVWKTLYSNDAFVQSITVLQIGKVTNYSSYLVSSAVDLSKVAGRKLNLEWAAGSVKGNADLSIAFINKDGGILQEIGKLTAQPNSLASEYSFVSFNIPDNITGIGFLAFIAGGDKTNRASFRVKNIYTSAASAEINITAEPQEVDFGTVAVGTSSEKKEISVSISNFTGQTDVTITPENTADFSINKEAVDNDGGIITAYFTPNSEGDKEAVITITAGTAALNVKLIGNGQKVAADKPTVELFTDPYMYDFNDNKPVAWDIKGTPTKLENNDRYHPDTGFGIGITTQNEAGHIQQIIDLKAEGKEVSEGDELECLIHYYTVETRHQGGPFRLAMRWLDSNGTEIDCEEKGFINNSDLYFGRMKAYGALKFRTVCPAGAEKLVFAIEIAPDSKVRMDDFSLLRLAAKDKSPLVAVLPQYRTIYGEVGVPVKYPIAIQGMHLDEDKEPNFSGTQASQVMKLGVDKLPQNGTLKTDLTITPAKKGAYVGGNAYSLKFSGADDANSGSLILMSYFKGAGKTPTIKLKNASIIKTMTAEPGKSEEQTVEFDITDVITNVDLAVIQQVNGPFRIDATQFYYAASSDKLYQKPVKITFRPTETGEYKATLMLTSILADTLKLEITGICKAAQTVGIVERFKADQPMDSRFKGTAWTNYHKFDQGYWKLEGKWNAPSNVTLNKNGQLYYDEILANGINTVSLLPSESAASCNVEISIDGGGHWQTLTTPVDNGNFKVNTNRPTLIRFVNTSADDLHVDSIVIVPNDADSRQIFSGIENAMLISADEVPLNLLNTTFTGLRHTRILGLEGWQNITVRGERPFYAWHQKNTDQTVVENEVAQISFLRYGTIDKREHETWLLSPTLSYKNAASKILTFSLRYQNPIENGKEKFGLFIITEKDGQVKSNYLNLTDYVIENITIEPGAWYDYRIDLSKVEGLEIDDLFHVAYSFYSPVGGNETSLNFMIDDVTFGRNDLPEISVDNDLVSFIFRVGQEMQPQIVNVAAERATAPVTITMVPSVMSKYFKVAPLQLNPEGGPVAVGFKSDDEQNRAAMLLVQTRGAVPVTVRLIAAMMTTNINELAENSQEVTANLTGNSINVSGQYTNYSIFSATGQLLKKGNAERVIDVSNLGSGILILKLETENGSKSFVFSKN